MNLNGIINMVIRMVMQRLIGHGVNAGINAASRGIGKGKDDPAAARAQAGKARVLGKRHIKIVLVVDDLKRCVDSSNSILADLRDRPGKRIEYADDNVLCLGRRRHGQACQPGCCS